MTETGQASDMAKGVGLLLGGIVVLASIATAGAAYLSEVQGSDTMQLLSGITLSVAIVAGCLAVMALHVLD